jgi:mono/diheme cytochrome c family protein
MIIGPRRETCADNPLLADCPRAYDVCRDNPLSAGCASAPEDVIPADELSIAAAENVLTTYCAACHGPALTEDQASASINYINDWRRLIRVGLIERCSPERSRIIRLMREGDMPPATSGVPSLPDAEIDLVAATIELGCNGE